MTRKEFDQLPHGVYWVHWKDGTKSVAAIGSNSSGHRWIAPTNWVHISSGNPGWWKQIKAVMMITY